MALQRVEFRMPGPKVVRLEEWRARRRLLPPEIFQSSGSILVAVTFTTFLGLLPHFQEVAPEAAGL